MLVKRMGLWCLLLVGLVTVVGCAKNDVPEKREPGLVYDAAAVSRILGLPCKCSDPIPQAKDGEIIVYYGGWDLKQLRNSPAGKKRMLDQNSEKHEWKAEPGYYRLLLLVPGSNKKTWNEQLRHLATNFDPAWQPAPVCIAATAVLVHLTESGNLLENNWCLCAEVLPNGRHAGLTVDGRVRVSYYWDGYPGDDVWLSAAQKVP